MNGTYQHRILFVYFNLFTIEDDGIRIRGRLHPWSDLLDFRKSSQQELAVLVFKNKKTMIFTRRFRKKDSELTLTFLGKNETYKNFYSFILGRLSEANKSPEYKYLENLRDKLVRDIETTNDRSTVTSLAKEFRACTSQLVHLDQQELAKSQIRYNKLLWKTALLMVVVLSCTIWSVFA